MHLVFAIIMIICLVGLPAYGQNQDTLTPEYAKCMTDAGGVDPAMIQCIEAETKRQDKKLNETYQKLLRKLSPKRQQELLATQRLWIKYTEANCNFYYDPDGGSATRLGAYDCAMNAKAARAKELESFLVP